MGIKVSFLVLMSPDNFTNKNLKEALERTGYDCFDIKYMGEVTPNDVVTSKLLSVRNMANASAPG